MHSPMLNFSLVSINDAPMFPALLYPLMGYFQKVGVVSENNGFLLACVIQLLLIAHPQFTSIPSRPRFNAPSAQSFRYRYGHTFVSINSQHLSTPPLRSVFWHTLLSGSPPILRFPSSLR